MHLYSWHLLTSSRLFLNNLVLKKSCGFKFVKKSDIYGNIFLVQSSKILRIRCSNRFYHTYKIISTFTQWSIMTYILQCSWNIFLLRGNSCRAAKRIISIVWVINAARGRAVSFLLCNMLSEGSTIPHSCCHLLPRNYVQKDRIWSISMKLYDANDNIIMIHIEL